MKIGDIVYYTGEYYNCHHKKYKITKTHNSLLGGVNLIKPKYKQNGRHHGQKIN